MLLKLFIFMLAAICAELLHQGLGGAVRAAPAGRGGHWHPPRCHQEGGARRLIDTPPSTGPSPSSPTGTLIWSVKHVSILLVLLDTDSWLAKLLSISSPGTLQWQTFQVGWPACSLWAAISSAVRLSQPHLLAVMFRPCLWPCFSWDPLRYQLACRAEDCWTRSVGDRWLLDGWLISPGD